MNLIFGRCKPRPRIHHLNDLQRTIRIIVATQAEIVKQFQDANLTLAKIGTETDSLLTKIADLQRIIDGMTDASPELVDAMRAVSASIKALDDKVPDLPPPTP